MTLSATDEQRVRAYLKDAGVTDRCPACGTEDLWLIGDVIAVVLPSPGSAIQSLSGLAMVPRTCQSCTHVMLFAAKPMGLAV